MRKKRKNRKEEKINPLRTKGRVDVENRGRRYGVEGRGWDGGRGWVGRFDSW